MDNFDHIHQNLLADVQALEQQFAQAWQTAALAPESANLLDLWQLIEPFLVDLSDAEQLRLAAFVIDQLAELHSLKADRLLVTWQDYDNDEGPLIEEDLLQGLVQRTMYLDLADLVRPKTRKTKSSPSQSIVGTVDKKKVLAMLEAIESEETLKQQALHVAHDESIGTWVSLISEWMGQQSKRTVALPELVQAVDLPLVKVWLALLLGNYVLESKGEFYATDQIWIHI